MRVPRRQRLPSRMGYAIYLARDLAPIARPRLGCQFLGGVGHLMCFREGGLSATAVDSRLPMPQSP